MGSMNALRTGTASVQPDWVPSSRPASQRDSGVFEEISLADEPPRPPAQGPAAPATAGFFSRLGQSETVRDLRFGLAVAKGVVMNVAGRAADGVLNGFAALKDKVAGFLARVGGQAQAPQGQAPQAQVPQAQPQNPPAQPPVQQNAPAQAVVAPLAPPRTIAQVALGAYDTVRSEQGKYIHGESHSYLRGSELSESNARMREASKTALQPVLNDFQHRIERRGPALIFAAHIRDNADAAKYPVASTTQFMSNLQDLKGVLFGDGSDDALRDKAAQFPQEFCVLAAVKELAVASLENRNADEKSGMVKLLAGQNMSLRTISVLLGEMSRDSRLVELDRTNMLGLAKTVQNAATNSADREPVAPHIHDAVRAEVAAMHTMIMRLNAFVVARGTEAAQAILDNR